MRSLLGRFHRPFARSVDEQLLSLNNLGDGSTLSLDFTTGVLDPRLTFTRSGTGTFINASGLVATASTNTPRFDYDPTSIGTPRGLLIEGSANNLAYYSESFNPANWTTTGLSGGVVTSTSQTNPAGISSSIRLVEDTANTAHATYQTIGGLTVGNTYTFSVYVRGDGTRTLAGIRITLSGAATDYSVIFDLADGTTGTAYTAGSPGTVTLRAVQHTGGWWRLSVTINAPSANTLFYIYNATTKNASGGLQAFLGTGNGIYVWGAQVEAGSGASSYIPTGASQGTRNADNCYIYDTTSSGGLSWFKTATQGTFYVEMFKRSAGTAFAAAGYGTRGTATQDFMLYQAVGNNWLSFNWGAENIVNYTPLSSPFLIKSAAALSPRVGTPTTADVLQSINGTAGTLNTFPNVTLPFTSDLFCIGSRGPAGGTASSQNYAETAIRRIKFFPFAMTAAQMNALTTL